MGAALLAGRDAWNAGKMLLVFFYLVADRVCLVVRFCWGAVLVVLLVHLTATSISDRVSRVRAAAIAVDGASEQAVAGSGSVAVALAGWDHRHGRRCGSLSTAAAAAADAAEQEDQ